MSEFNTILLKNTQIKDNKPKCIISGSLDEVQNLKNWIYRALKRVGYNDKATDFIENTKNMSTIKEVYEESLKYVYYSEEQERRLQDKINNI